MDDAANAGPHQGMPVIHAGKPVEQASAAMVMLHGRGASAESILELAGALDQLEFAYVAPQAADHTWYPHSFLVPWEQNEPKVSSALRAVDEVVRMLERAGLSRERIMLLGFSQGACLASEYAAGHPGRYAGLAILTGGLIGDAVDPARYEGSFEQTPVLLASGDPDPHIPWDRVEQTARVYEKLGARVTMQRYPGRPHTVSQDEIERVRAMMSDVAEK